MPKLRGGGSGAGNARATTRIDAWAETDAQKEHKASIARGDKVELVSHMDPAQQYRDRQPALRQHAYRPPSARTLLPHPGSSYNPDEATRQAAVESAASEIARQERFARRVELAQPRFLKHRKHKRTRQEVEDDASDDEEDKVAKSEGGSDTEEPEKKRKKVARKTIADRNREAANRLDHVKSMRKNKKAKLMGQVDKLDKITAEIKEEQAARDVRREKRLSKDVKSKLDNNRIKRLGGVKFRVPAVHVLPEGGVTRNLRVQQIGDAAELPVKERFSGLKERNWISAQGPRKERKTCNIAKWKTFVKYSV
jgi:hypothetical protein